MRRCVDGRPDHRSAVVAVSRGANGSSVAVCGRDEVPMLLRRSGSDVALRIGNEPQTA
jgi:hypothetical protein